MNRVVEARTNDDFSLDLKFDDGSVKRFDVKPYLNLGVFRELQNVVERAIILSETDTFVVDESWLRRESADSPRPYEGLSALGDREVEMIEAAKRRMAALTSSKDASGYRP